MLSCDSVLSYALFLRAVCLVYSPICPTCSSWPLAALPVFSEYFSVTLSLKSFYFHSTFSWWLSLFSLLSWVAHVFMIFKCAFVLITHFPAYLFFYNEFLDSIPKYPSKNCIPIKPALPLMLPILIDVISSISITDVGKVGDIFDFSFITDTHSSPLFLTLLFSYLCILTALPMHPHYPHCLVLSY